jgi:hypothetical protein
MVAAAFPRSAWPWAAVASASAAAPAPLERAARAVDLACLAAERIQAAGLARRPQRSATLAPAPSVAISEPPAAPARAVAPARAMTPRPFATAAASASHAARPAARAVLAARAKARVAATTMFASAKPPPAAAAGELARPAAARAVAVRPSRVARTFATTTCFARATPAPPAVVRARPAAPLVEPRQPARPAPHAPAPARTAFAPGAAAWATPVARGILAATVAARLAGASPTRAPARRRHRMPVSSLMHPLQARAAGSVRAVPPARAAGLARAASSVRAARSARAEPPARAVAERSSTTWNLVRARSVREADAWACGSPMWTPAPPPPSRQRPPRQRSPSISPRRAEQASTPCTSRGTTRPTPALPSGSTSPASADPPEPTTQAPTAGSAFGPRDRVRSMWWGRWPRQSRPYTGEPAHWARLALGLLQLRTAIIHHMEANQRAVLIPDRRHGQPLLAKLDLESRVPVLLIYQSRRRYLRFVDRRPDVLLVRLRCASMNANPTITSPNREAEEPRPT